MWNGKEEREAERAKNAALTESLFTLGQRRSLAAVDTMQILHRSFLSSNSYLRILRSCFRFLCMQYKTTTRSYMLRFSLRL